MVGIQGSFSPVIRKMKEVFEGGKLGKLLSSTIVASLGNAGTTESKNVRYFLDREVGGNVMSVHMGHSLEFVATGELSPGGLRGEWLMIMVVLGEFKSWDSLLSNRHEVKDVVDPANDNKIVVKDAPNTVPDQIMLHGLVAPSNAPVSIHFRGGKPFPGSPGIDWRIQGDKGELRLTSPSCSLNVGRPDTKIEWYDVGKETVEVLVPNKDVWDDLPTPAHNIARQYEAYRKGDWHPDFEWAVKRHMMLEEIWARYDDAQMKN
jgi:predicted dehydrogenase